MADITRQEFEDAAGELAESLAGDLKKRMLNAFDALKTEEVNQIRPYNYNAYFVARAIGVVVVPDAVRNCLETDAVNRVVREVKDMLNSRHW